MKKIMNIATQKNENTDNLKKTIVKTNEQLKKKTDECQRTMDNSK